MLDLSLDISHVFCKIFVKKNVIFMVLFNLLLNVCKEDFDAVNMLHCHLFKERGSDNGYNQN